MIVDVHTRIWASTEQLGLAAESLRRRRTEPWQRPTATAGEHDEAMAPIENAIILGFESRLLGASIPHEQVAGYVAAQPGKYLGFAGIDPTADHPVRSLERALAMGLVGVVISPAAQGFHPSDTRAMELYEACEAKGVPLLIEPSGPMAREAKLEFAQPYLLDEVARTFPKLRMVLGAFGHPWIDQGLTLIGKHPTVFGDLSELIARPWQLYNALVLAHQQGVTSQILFGSNFPFGTPEKAIIAVYSVNSLVQGTNLPTVPREQLRSIVERDTLTCLGLSIPPASASRASESRISTKVGDDAPRSAMVEEFAK